MIWLTELVVEGPVNEVALLDATWQGEPEWGSDPWVAMDAPELVCDGPPFPGILIRVAVPAGKSLRLAVSDSAPEWAPLRVAASELIVGHHGFALSAGNELRRGVPVAVGNYPVEIWLDPIAPGQARALAVVLGPWQPRRLPTRLR